MRRVNLKSTRARWALETGVIFLFSLAVRMAFIAWQGPVTSPDTAEYRTLAQNLVSHSVFSLDTSAPFLPSTRRAPLYPAFLALLAWLGATSPVVVVALQAVLDAGVAVVILRLGEMVVARKWAYAAAVMYAAHPGAILASGSLLSEALFTDLLVGSALMLAMGVQQNYLLLVGMAGFCLGLAVLCRPVALLLPVVLTIVLVCVRGVRRPLVVGGVFLIVTMLVVFPWISRSSILAHQFVPVQAFGSINLYTATRTDWDQKREAILWPRVWTEFRVAAARTPEEMANLDRNLLRQAINNVVAAPGRYIVSRGKELPFLFLTSFDKFTGVNESFSAVISERKAWRFVVKVIFLVTFSVIPILFAAIGWPGARRHPAALISATLWLYFIVVHLPIWFESRFWWPAVPFVLASGAIGAARLEDFCRLRE